MLRDNPLLLLFVVAALGYPLGELKFRGGSLGPAAVLFVGLAFGAIDPQLHLPEIIPQFGLLLFVYTVGLSNGTGFFASFRRRGLRDSLFTLGLVGFGGMLVVGAHCGLGLSAATSAGLFAGSLTNTPALASVLEVLRERLPPDATTLLSEPVVAYSVAYPMGVIGVLLAVAIVLRFWRIDFAQEAATLRDAPLAHQKLACRTLRVTWSGPETLGELSAAHSWQASFGRIQRHGDLLLADEFRGFAYQWVTDQAEYSTDVLFRDAAELKLLCESRLREWMQQAVSAEGIAVCPETAACVGALESLRQSGWIKPDERVVIFNTGAAQKYVEAIAAPLPHLDIHAPLDWSAIAAAE